MKTKRQYLAANIRAGMTATNASKWCADHGYVAPYSVDVDSFNHGRDVYGNGTAHYRCQLVDGLGRYILTIVESGKRREQVGYSGQNEAALYALDKLGFTVETSKAGNYDHQKSAVYPLLNFPVSE